MDTSQAVLVRRPERWDQPLDPTMSDDDVRWLRTRGPFAAMREDSFSKATPLLGILKNDCRIRRCQRGEILVRQGDYGQSAFFILAGSVRVSLERLPEESLGRPIPRRLSWRQAISQLWNRFPFAEVRSPAEITSHDQTRISAIDKRPTISLQDFSAVFHGRRSVGLGPGEIFGEIAAMYRTPQTATVISECEATILEIRWQGLRLLRRDPSFSAEIERHYRTHWLIPHLREIPLLRFLPEDVLQRVADAAILRSFGRMDWHSDFQKTRQLSANEQIQQEPLIAIEGNIPTDLIILRAGFARVSMNHGAGHQTTAYLGKRDLFGFTELAENMLRTEQSPPIPLAHSLRAIGFVDTLHIPAETFAEWIFPYVRRGEIRPSAGRGRDASPLNVAAAPPNPAGSERSERRVVPRDKPGEPISDPSSTLSQHVSTGLVEFLVQQRLNNGREAMVIDLDRCTRCDDCVRACATTHGGNPRMIRSGSTFDHLMFAQACMHCADPVCLIGCPTGAIARDEVSGTISIHEPVCIGCGTCAAACPYQNINMTEVRNHLGQPYRDTSSGLPILKATKCDLCHTQPSGPACQRACPHDALVRIDLSHVGPLDQWLGTRR